MSLLFVLKDFQFFPFHTGRPILITPEGQLSGKGVLPTSEMGETEGFQCLGHSNWTICSLLSPFCSENFPIFPLSYWGANSYYPRGLIMGKGSSHNPKTEWDSGVSVLGAFILDHLHHFKPILFRKRSNFFTFIMESQFLLPQPIMGKGNSHNPKSEWQWVLRALGIQTGPFESL